MNLQLVTPPTEWPLYEAEFEAHARAKGQPLDQLQPYIQAAASHLETICNRRFLQQTWKLFLDGFPASGEIVLPYSPLVSVTHLKYTNTAGTQTTLPTTEYAVSLRTPGVLRLKYNKTWPTDTLETTDPIEVQFVCGWSNAASVPLPLKQAIRMLASHFYENREAVIVGTTAAVDEAELPFAVSALIAPWRVWL
jgi:uncharacterized phiE125 gp8 family phage protein